MSDLAVFVDGPLRGKTLEVASWQVQSGWTWQVAREQDPPAEVALAERPWTPPGLLEFDDAVYRFRYFAMFGRVVLAGSVADPPSPEDCFDVLCSDAAKRSALFPQPC